MNQNTIVENSIFGSKFFDPNYLFNQSFALAHRFFDYIGGSYTKITYIFYFALFFFSLFFLSIICYTIIRLFEIRVKEHKHLHHEIAESARNKAEQEKR